MRSRMCHGTRVRFPPPPLLQRWMHTPGKQRNRDVLQGLSSAPTFALPSPQASGIVPFSPVAGQGLGPPATAAQARTVTSTSINCGRPGRPRPTVKRPFDRHSSAARGEQPVAPSVSLHGFCRLFLTAGRALVPGANLVLSLFPTVSSDDSLQPFCTLDCRKCDCLAGVSVCFQAIQFGFPSGIAR
jgi:hypothetical protein